MRKTILKFIKKLYDNSVVRVILYVAGILGVFYISKLIHAREESFFDSIVLILTSEETISVFIAGILSIGIAKLMRGVDSSLEESLKTEDNHHRIINMYSGHAKKEIGDGNYFDKTGVFMSLNGEHVEAFSKSEYKNPVKDIYSNEYEKADKAIKEFKVGKLYLPSVNVYTNKQGNTNLIFDDKNEPHDIHDFIIENGLSLFRAHQNSAKSNNITIRLSDFSNDGNTLTLSTERSTYYHMLITNRCMDFEFEDDITLRKLYEYKKTISPLNESFFSNQIGINGLIISKDGYVLLEKRDNKKTTWKNKFAQSISLALKEDDLKKMVNGVIPATEEGAEFNLKKIIEKTIKGNFGLDESDYQVFTVNKNFLGLARDLLEGGKPNLYFYVVTNDSAEELAKKLKEYASKAKPKKTQEDRKDGKHEEKEEYLQTGKLVSDYYLVPFKDIKINYHYVLKTNRRNIIKVYRKVPPRKCGIIHFAEKAEYTFLKIFKPTFKRECGEALLVTLSYLELCKDRIPEINQK